MVWRLDVPLVLIYLRYKMALELKELQEEGFESGTPLLFLFLENWGKYGRETGATFFFAEI